MFCVAFVFLWITFVHSSFAIILKRKRKLVALLLLSFRCIVTINVLWRFLTVPWVGLQCVLEVFSGYTHLLWGLKSIFGLLYGWPFRTGYTKP